MNFPDWFKSLAQRAPEIKASDLSSYVQGEPNGRDAAVLILFADGARGGDLLITQRAAHLRNHAGQPAFPGGRVEQTDESLAHTALREAQEETGLNPESVHVIATLPTLWLPPSQFNVTPILGYWHEPHELGIGIDGEATHIHRVPISDLVDPQNRVMVKHPRGTLSPGFQVSDMLVWGFTGGLVNRLLQLGEWEVPWDNTAIVHLPDTESPEATD